MINKKYTLNQRKRTGYTTLILCEYSLPDDNGLFQRVKVIADFGNIDNKENRHNARITKKFMERIVK